MAKKKENVGEKSLEELKSMLVTLRDELLKLRLDHARQKVKNTSLLTNTRKQIARVLTAIQAKKEVQVNG